jgi:ent-kaurene synthase
LSHVVELSNFRNSLQGYLNDTKSILELYKASKVSVSENEFLLDSMGYWSGSLLMEKLLSDGGETRPIFGEVLAWKFKFRNRINPRLCWGSVHMFPSVFFIISGGVYS